MMALVPWQILLYVVPALSAWLLVRGGPGGWSPVQRVLALLVVWVVLAVFGTQLVAALAAIHWIDRFSPVRVLVMHVAVLFAVVAARARGRSRPVHRPSLPPGPVLPVAGVIGALYLVLFLDRVTGVSRSWDGVAYHLPLMVRWLQDGSLSLAGSMADWRMSLPANAEVFALPMLGVSRHAAVETVNLVAAVVGALAVADLASRVSPSPAGRWMSALLFLSVPLVAYQAFSSYVDLFGSAFVLAALALLLDTGTSSSGASRRWKVVVTGLAIGVAIGTKPTLWPYAATLVGGAVVMFSKRRWWEAGLLAVAVVVPSGFWFVRAWLQTGNPVYPIAVHTPFFNLAGWSSGDITPVDYDRNFVRSSWEWLVYPWVEFKRAGYNFSAGSGLGPAFAAFVPPGIAHAVIQSVRRRTRAELMLVVILVGWGVIWLALLRRMPRFGIPVIGVACALSVGLIDRLLPVRRRWFAWMTVVVFGAGAAMSALPAVQRMGSRIVHGAWTPASQYHRPAQVDAFPEGTVVINLNDRLEYWDNFSLAGVRLQNRVVPWWEAGRLSLDSLDFSRRYAIMDRAPFAVRPDSMGFIDLGFRLEVDPGRSPWRMWVREPAMRVDSPGGDTRGQTSR